MTRTPILVGSLSTVSGTARQSIHFSRSSTAHPHATRASRRYLNDRSRLSESCALHRKDAKRIRTRPATARGGRPHTRRTASRHRAFSRSFCVQWRPSSSRGGRGSMANHHSARSPVTSTAREIPLGRIFRFHGGFFFEISHGSRAGFPFLGTFQELHSNPYGPEEPPAEYLGDLHRDADRHEVLADEERRDWRAILGSSDRLDPRHENDLLRLLRSHGSRNTIAVARARAAAAASICGSITVSVTRVPTPPEP